MLAALLGASSLVAGAVPGAAAPPPRHVGDSALEAIEAQAVAAVAEHPGCYGLTVARLVPTALAIMFKEAGTGLNKAPSPMTLSRNDVYRADGTGFQPYNYGLYAFNNPTTEYQRAFWHPGVGMWQLDDSGLGTNFTASERINVDISTRFVVPYLADRWCSPGSPSSITQGRQRAWGDWGCRTSSTSTQCKQLESYYQELYVDGGMAILQEDPISVLGGAVERSCRLGGAQLPCTYVNPAAAQGDTWWRSTAISGASPIAYPFYVIEQAGKELRIWLREDTGYDIDISATRVLGRNSRPFGAGNGLTWASSADLCDLTAVRGSCDPTEPTPLELAPAAPPQRRVLDVPPGREAVVGDYDGDGLDDVVWYGAGAVSDALWWGAGNGTFTAAASPKQVTGTYEPVVATLSPDGFDDILWYAPADGRTVRWDSLGDGRFAPTTHYASAGATPLVADFDGDTRDEVLWYRPGANADQYWDVAADGTLVQSTRDVRGTYLPLVGDFDDNGVADIFWYGAGSAPDSVWMHQPDGTRVSRPASVKGVYEPAVGDLDGDGHTDIYWYAPGAGADTMWFGIDGATWDPRPQTLKGTYDLVAADLDGNGAAELTLYAKGFASDRIWRVGGSRTRTEINVRIDGTYATRPARLGTPGSPAGLLWYAPSGYAVAWYP